MIVAVFSLGETTTSRIQVIDYDFQSVNSAYQKLNQIHNEVEENCPGRQTWIVSMNSDGKLNVVDIDLKQLQLVNSVKDLMSNH